MAGKATPHDDAREDEAAREWIDAADYAEAHPHDDEAWLRANRAYTAYRKTRR